MFGTFRAHCHHCGRVYLSTDCIRYCCPDCQLRQTREKLAAMSEDEKRAIVEAVEASLQKKRKTVSDTEWDHKMRELGFRS